MSQKSEGAKPRSRKPVSTFLRIGLWVAVILHILVFVFFRLGSNHLPDREYPKPYVTFVSEDSLAKDSELEEYALLFDSAPLFVPTAWNASQLIEVDLESASLGELPEFKPRIKLFDELEPEGLLGVDSYTITGPMDLLASRFWRFFEDFGRSAKSLSPFEKAMPVAEIFPVDQPQGPVTSIAVDLDSEVSFVLPNPVSFALQHSKEGLIRGIPTLTETSGNEVFDRSVARWLQRPDILAKLPEGYLLIRVFFW